MRLWGGGVHDFGGGGVVGEEESFVMHHISWRVVRNFGERSGKG